MTERAPGGQRDKFKQRGGKTQTYNTSPGGRLIRVSELMDKQKAESNLTQKSPEWSYCAL